MNKNSPNFDNVKIFLYMVNTYRLLLDKASQYNSSTSYT